MAWRERDRTAYVALFLIVSLVPAMVLTIGTTRLCFTSSERATDGCSDGDDEFVLADFDDFMLTRCPLPPSDLSGFYPNATAGKW